MSFPTHHRKSIYNCLHSYGFLPLLCRLYNRVQSPGAKPPGRLLLKFSLKSFSRTKLQTLFYVQ